MAHNRISSREYVSSMSSEDQVRREKLPVEEGFEDLLSSGGILRKVITPSDGKKPELGDEVKIKYNGYLYDEDVHFAKDVEEIFRIGEGQVLHALELGTKLMALGETCVVHCVDRFAYDAVGFPPKVPPHAALKFEIELLAILGAKKNAEDMTAPEMLDEATKKKNSGNKFFSAKLFDGALRQYTSAVKLLESYKPNEATNDACRTLLISLGNNIANAHLQLGTLKQGRDSCIQVLQIDPQNVKALYRLAKICYQADEVDEGMHAAIQAAKLDPQSKIIRDLLSKLQERRKALREKEKALFENFLPEGEKDTEEAETEAESIEDIDPNELFREEKPEWQLTNYDLLVGALLAALLAVFCYIAFA